MGMKRAPVAECLSIYEQILSEANFSVPLHKYRIGIAFKIIILALQCLVVIPLL